MRLIDADNATAVVGYFLEQMGIMLFGRSGKGKDLARRLLLQVPTIEAMSVVRCKECKYKQRCHKAVEHITHEPTSVTIGYKSVDFCSYGEREDE